MKQGAAGSATDYYVLLCFATASHAHARSCVPRSEQLCSVPKKKQHQARPSQTGLTDVAPNHSSSNETDPRQPLCVTPAAPSFPSSLAPSRLPPPPLCQPRCVACFKCAVSGQTAISEPVRLKFSRFSAASHFHANPGLHGRFSNAKT